MQKTKDKLLIISDTPMWPRKEGIAVFEATLREVEHLTDLFDEIVWIGFQNPSVQQGNNARPPAFSSIRCILLPMTGGPGIKNKIKQVLALWHYYLVIRKELKGVKYVHTRAPSIPAWIALYISLRDKKRRWWHKFAGNWAQENPPTSYLQQKKLMLRAKHTRVALNGQWSDQLPHTLSFENPCFSTNELAHANEVATNKVFEAPFNLLFVGRIEVEKGVERILDALNMLKEEERSWIAKVDFVGKGKDLNKLKKKAESIPLNISFPGPKSREELDGYYARAHLFLFPSSASEGFPKVVAEAAAFGNLLMVSEVSSLKHYIFHQENGIVFQGYGPENIIAELRTLMKNPGEIRKLAMKGRLIANAFTYERYNERVKNELLRMDE